MHFPSTIFHQHYKFLSIPRIWIWSQMCWKPWFEFPNSLVTSALSSTIQFVLMHTILPYISSIVILINVIFPWKFWSTSWLENEMQVLNLVNRNLDLGLIMNCNNTFWSFGFWAYSLHLTSLVGYGAWCKDGLHFRALHSTIISSDPTFKS
jgi:hypothetical protein